MNPMLLFFFKKSLAIAEGGGRERRRAQEEEEREKGLSEDDSPGVLTEVSAALALRPALFPEAHA